VLGGWPASTCSGGRCPETRGLAAADLDRDGHTEIVATTTNTSPTGSQVFVFEPDGSDAPGWPRERCRPLSARGQASSDLTELLLTTDDRAREHGAPARTISRSR
jgi:hypothetical protein